MGSTDSGRRAFAERLGIAGAGERRLERALSHRSASGAGLGYERLEFLGDRVVGLLAAERLLQRFPSENEGAIARRHTALVRRDTLAEIARALDIGPLVIMSESEERGGGRENPAILSDVLEAVLAVVYLERGLDAARDLLAPYLDDHADRSDAPPRDAKTALQEWLQRRGRPLPAYRVVDRTGPDHAPEFTVEVSADGAEPVQARGRSKRQAETDAAEAMLAALDKTDD